MATVIQDLRFALRQLRRSPGFTLTALLTLGLGIGVNTAAFSLVQHVLLEPLPYPQQQQLVGIGFPEANQPASGGQTGESAMLVAQQSTSYQSVGISDGGALSQNFSVHGSSPRAVESSRVSAGYLPTLGIAPLLGRTFTTDEDQPGTAHTAILSESLWRGTLNADPNVLGKLIHLNGDAYTVIGVMPRSLATVDAPDVWEPLHLSPANPGYGGDNFQMIARLRPGVSLAHAGAELQTLNRELYREFPHYEKWNKPGAPKLQMTLAPLQQVVTSHAKTSLFALSLAVMAVLLMVCLNLGGLLLARSAVRQRELSVRVALGASRGSMLRLLMLENLLLAAGGSAIGILVSVMLVPALLRNTTLNLPSLQRFHADWRIALFALALGIVTMALFGLFPSLRALRHSFSPATAARTSTGGVGQQRLGKVLLITQVAVTTTLLSISTLLMGAFLKMRSLPVGVDVSGLYTAQVTLRGSHFQTAAGTIHFIDAVLQRLRGSGLPLEAAAVNGLPLDRGLNSTGGPTAHPEMARNMQGRFVAPGYFHVSGQRLLAGEDISASVTSTSAPVALINQRAAQLWFGEQPAIGEFVKFSGSKPMRIIGVVEDARGIGLADAVRPTVYLPFSQLDDDTASAINGWFPTTFVMRVASDRANTNDKAAGAMLLQAVSDAVSTTDREVPLGDFAPMQHFIDKSVNAPKFFTSLATSFGALAVLLSALGTFGLLSYQVSSRTREFGVRMALGSDRGGVLRLVLWRGFSLALAGVAIGAAGFFAIRQILGTVLAEIMELSRTSLAGVLTNPSLTFTAAAGIIFATVLLAGSVPAHRAAIIEPAEALRAE